MGRKEEKSGWGAGVVLVVVLLALLFAPTGMKGTVVLLATPCVFVALFRGRKKKLPVAAGAPQSATTNFPERASASASVGGELRAQEGEEFLTVALSGDSANSSYRIARPPFETSSGVRWVAAGESVDVGGTTITGGLFYIGVPKRGEANRGADACVVNPKATLARTTCDRSAGPNDYWLSYSTFSAEQRCAYVQWLASARSDPKLHRSFAMFYLYGLERRVLVDGMEGKVPKHEFETIAAELRRLRETYPEVLGSAYVDGMLEFISVHLTQPLRQYEQAPPPLTNSFELPLSVRVAFGQAAIDRKPVPVEWALAWVFGDGMINKRTPAYRCGKEFKQLFERRYRERFRDGMKLSANKTKLKAPVSAAFSALHSVVYPEYITSLPDISAVSGPRKQLQELVFECTEALDAYSRFLGKYPESEGSLESSLLLPLELWPETTRGELESVAATVANGTVVTTFGSLFERFKASGNLTRDKLTAFARVLGEAGVALEPDVRTSGRTPKSTDSVALYATPPGTSTNHVDDAYVGLELMVDMAASVAMADGTASEQELAVIHRQIEAWPQLTPRQRDRLRARIHVQVAQPPTPASFKKRLEPLPVDARQSIGTILLQTANAGGIASPAEVKLLEKLYLILGLDSQQLYSDLHGNAVAGTSASSRPAAPPEERGGQAVQPVLQLDAARIAALQTETAKVSAMLADVFADDEPTATVEPVEEQEPDSEGAVTATLSLLGMDEAHSTFLRLLLSRPVWTRAELADAASDLDLMLDGAIEQVNEATLDHWDEPLIDGDDPIEINQEFAKRLAP
ncbi:TerB N-terminal domain-containing protein [Paraburkholderia ribeironis]|nr:TerB N-terminal domain-containing protein [Paraburkholderia ribeironis]